jgi:hypothetical protein
MKVKARSMMDGGSLGYALPMPAIPSPLSEKPLYPNGQDEPVKQIKKRFSFGLHLGRNKDSREKRRTMLNPTVPPHF